ncbi:MAG TPA: hypothetical protein PLB96_14930, partial [Syntrophales bacterium]|nr:hypothetical protein [Syntrophales bacterium]
VMDAVSTFGDVEDPWNVHCRKTPYGRDRFGPFSPPWMDEPSNGAADHNSPAAPHFVLELTIRSEGQFLRLWS